MTSHEYAEGLKLIAFVSNGTITVFVHVNEKDEIELTVSGTKTGEVIRERILSPGVQYDD